jgi:hypothetical protein
MVIVSLLQIEIVFGFPAISVVLSAAILTCIDHVFVAVVVTSNAVPLLGVISSILIQACPGAVPIKSISLQVNVLVCIASEKVNKNFPVKSVVDALCPPAKSIVISGLVVSQVHEIGQKYPQSVFPVRYASVCISFTKVSLSSAVL